jgi:hypothetical protein
MGNGTAVQKVDRGTGEVVEVETFDFKGYLTHLSGTKALQEQQQLAGAYDAACKSLIGPNDVQKDGNRDFKKKSAWRKLARHFGISTEVVRQQERYMAPEDGAGAAPIFIATVVVRANAPWGQSAESVGACATDEETGRRTITIADAIATAETRATNRAISNLIAMGEVSAEEMSKGERAPEARPTGDITRTTEVPFGKHKGKTVDEAGRGLLGLPGGQAGRKGPVQLRAVHPGSSRAVHDGTARADREHRRLPRSTERRRQRRAAVLMTTALVAAANVPQTDAKVAPLYKLADAYVQLLDLIAENAGEVSPEVSAALDANQDQMRTKIEHTIRYVRNRAALRDAALAEARQLQEYAATLDAGIVGIKRMVMEQLERAGIPKVETSVGTIRIQANGRPSIAWEGSIDLLPEAYRRISVSLDGTKAFEDYKAGKLPETFTVVTGKHLRGL